MTHSLRGTVFFISSTTIIDVMFEVRHHIVKYVHDDVKEMLWLW